MARLLFVVPPAAISMAGGPPAAVGVLRNAFDNAGFATELYDGNAQFFRSSLLPDIRQRVQGELHGHLRKLLAKTKLDSSQLSEIGRLLAFCEGEKQRSTTMSRTGMSWAGLQYVLAQRGDAGRPQDAGATIWSDLLDKLAGEILQKDPGAIAFTILLHEQIPGFVELGARLACAGYRRPMLAGGAVFKLADDRFAGDLLARAKVSVGWRSDLFAVPSSLRAWLRGEGSLASVTEGGAVISAAQQQSSQAFSPPPRRLPGPLRQSGIDTAPYLEPRIFPVLVSVGCYWGKCDFCDYPFLASRTPGSSNTRFRRPADVAEDVVEICREFGIKRIDLISDAIAYGWFSQLDRVAGARLRDSGPSLECSVRAEPGATPRHFEDMARVGVRAITLGVEVLHDEVLAGMKKGNTVADILRCVRLANAVGIAVKANLIVDHPRIRAEHIPDMLKTLEELAPMLDALALHRFALSPHAPIVADLESLGIERRGQGADNDRGTHTLHFVRRRPDVALSDGIERLSRAAEAWIYELEHRAGRAPSDGKVIRLPYVWGGVGASRDEERGNLHVLVPARRAPFEFFVGESSHE
jgi:hypothetical protein